MLEISPRLFVVTRLDSCFDEIIWLKSGERKSAYIRHTDSIFIDDSFAERLDVQESCGIAVFDAHMLEALLQGSEPS